MHIDQIFIMETSDKTKVWIEIIKALANQEQFDQLNRLDSDVWSLVDRRRDEISYYHGKKRAGVHVGNCYQQVVVDLLKQVLISNGVSGDIIYLKVDGANSEFTVANKELVGVEQLHSIIADNKKISAVYRDITPIYSNEIYVSHS